MSFFRGWLVDSRSVLLGVSEGDWAEIDLDAGAGALLGAWCGSAARGTSLLEVFFVAGGSGRLVVVGFLLVNVETDWAAGVTLFVLSGRSLEDSERSTRTGTLGTTSLGRWSVCLSEAVVLCRFAALSDTSRLSSFCLCCSRSSKGD